MSGHGISELPLGTQFNDGMDGWLAGCGCGDEWCEGKEGEIRNQVPAPHIPKNPSTHPPHAQETRTEKARGQKSKLAVAREHRDVGGCHAGLEREAPGGLGSRQQSSRAPGPRVHPAGSSSARRRRGERLRVGTTYSC